MPLMSSTPQLNRTQTWTAVNTFDGGIDLNSNNLDNAVLGTTLDANDQDISNIKILTFGNILAGADPRFASSSASNQLLTLTANFFDIADAGKVTMRLINTATGVSGANILSLDFRGDDDGGTSRLYGEIDIFSEDASAGSFDGKIAFRVTESSVSTAYIVLNEDGGADIDILKDLTIADAKNIVLNTTTGTKIGTATGQKIGIWNATPIVQPVHIVDADGTLADITTKFNTWLAQADSIGLQAAS